MTSSLTGIYKIKDLRKKLGVTLFLLLVYRMGTYITMPGIDVDAVNAMFARFAEQTEGIGKMMQMVNMFGGGAISKAAIFSLGIMPYITASILFQILTSVYPSLKALQKEGESGRRKINQYTRYATLVLCLVQSFVICRSLQNVEGGALVPNPGFTFIFVGMVCLTCGTMIVMWLGEMITEFGLGNGISIIIMAGILAELPMGAYGFYGQLNDGTGQTTYLTLGFLLTFFIVVTIVIIYTTLGQRRIPIRQNKRVAGAAADARAHYLPLRVNMAGVIPIIFAQAIIMFPTMLGQWMNSNWLMKYFGYGQVLYTVMFVGLIVFFCFFYTSMIFNPSEMSENMKQGGTFIPGIRPGAETTKFFEILIMRITVIGAVTLAVVAIIPQILNAAFNIDNVFAGIFGGTGLLIVVGVALDLIQKVEGHMVTQNFNSMLESGQAQRKAS